MRSRCCVCVYPLIGARQRLGKSPLIVATQRLGKNPPIVARQRLGRNVTAVTNTYATIRESVTVPDTTIQYTATHHGGVKWSHHTQYI
jgi:hypothetical protein